MQFLIDFLILFRRFVINFSDINLKLQSEIAANFEFLLFHQKPAKSETIFKNAPSENEDFYNVIHEIFWSVQISAFTFYISWDVLSTQRHTKVLQLQFFIYLNLFNKKTQCKVKIRVIYRIFPLELLQRTSWVFFCLWHYQKFLVCITNLDKKKSNKVRWSKGLVCIFSRLLGCCDWITVK